MKKINLLILATSLVALLSCSTTNPPSLDDDDTLFDEQTRGKTSQNDSTKGGGVSATITPRETVSVDVVATEIPKDEGKNDTIPNDSIPNDSIPKDSTKNL